MKQFRVVLHIGGTQREATVTITDNDELSASITAPETVAEGETAPFTVSSVAAPAPRTWWWATPSAVPRRRVTDYTDPGERLTIQSGQSSVTLAIQTNTDDEIEPTRPWW